MGNLTASDRRILTAINTGASSLSLLGSSFIVLCYLLFKDLRRFSFKLVFFLALSDMLCSFFNIVGYAVLLNLGIGFFLHFMRFGLYMTANGLLPYHLCGCIGTSLVMMVMRYISNDHGHIACVGAWCWTESGRTGKAVHFITFYAPLWGAIIFNGITYFQVIKKLNNATHMAVGMSDQTFQSDARTDMKDHGLLAPSTASMTLLSQAIKSFGFQLSMLVWLHLWLPERFRSWLPKSVESRGQQQQESELVSLRIQDQEQ